MKNHTGTILAVVGILCFAASLFVNANAQPRNARGFNPSTADTGAVGVPRDFYVMQDDFFVYMVSRDKMLKIDKALAPTYNNTQLQYRQGLEILWHVGSDR